MATGERLSAHELAALRAHAQRALEAVDQNRGAREGESVWHTPGSRVSDPWTPAALASLEQRGLIEVREEWKDNFVRITPAGFATLAAGGAVSGGEDGDDGA